MNFPRFQRPAQPPSRQSTSKPEDSRLPAPGPAGPAPPVLTRPRAGAVNGQQGNTGHFTSSGATGVTDQTANGGPMMIQRRDPVEDAMQQPTDSLNLGQLKAATAGMQPKQKVQQFTYRYDDTDTLMNELDEFYSYEDVPHVAKAPERFAEDFKGTRKLVRVPSDPAAWTETPLQKRKEYLIVQLDYLESASRTIRRGAQQRVLYLLQGCFAETTAPEMQLHWVMENAKTIRSIDGLGSLVTALKDANRRYTTSAEKSSGKPSSSASDGPLLQPIDPTDDNSAELIDVLGMLYFVVEVFRTDDTFGDELMSMSHPLPLLLFQMVAGLKDRLPKMYPVKKVLLLLWKTLLASLGGMKDAEKAKALTREQAGLPPVNKEFFTKASPIDITNWRRDMSVKYTTFHPSSTTEEKLAEGIKPIPPRPNYHSTEIPSAEIHRTKPLAPAQQGVPMPPNAPGTPAPSPPLVNANGQQQQFGQPGKPKKQQFQTDPSRPFIFPFSHTPQYSPGPSSSASSSRSSRSNTTFDQPGPSGLVPYAIAEADKLFARHAYVSLGLYQLWEARDECMREERGLGKRGLIGFEDLALEDEDAAEVEARRLEWKLEEEEMEASSRGDKEGAKRARERLIAAKRLSRVDTIYRSTLPSMQSCVIVLLKFLLATVTGPGAAHMTAQGNAVPPGFQSPTQEAPQPEPERPPPTKAEIDVARHREITSKAVSAILVLLLKWFKASHVLKFHYLAQLLFDSNCLLLVLKMFGLADVWQTVTVKHEWEDSNFFRYCHLHCSKSPPRPEDSILQNPSSPKPPDTDGDVEYISEYSWRNFFSTINFLKILQKMTKHRTHRTYMLHQYKSSQILKRMLRANQPMMQLQVLKLIKSQMPWCGRKWRQTNMKTITSIYLNCRPDLKDDWLAGTDQDTEIDDALPQEYALRSLVAFYNRQNYSLNIQPTHHRSSSVSGMTLEDPALNPQQPESHIRRSTSSTHSERDVFPPRSTSTDGGYNPDEMIEFWIHEYEDVLLEVFGESEPQDMWQGDNGPVENGTRPMGSVPGAAARDDPAWTRLDEIMRSRNGGEDDVISVISDSESVVTVGELGDEATAMGAIELGDVGGFARQQLEEPSSGKNTWEHMSPTTLSRLPPSPLERRRRSSAAPDPISGSTGRRRSSNSSSPLRPVFRQENTSSPLGPGLGALGGGDNTLDLGPLGESDDPFDDDDEDFDMRGPMPIAQGTTDQRERLGAVDEVEYAYGE